MPLLGYFFNNSDASKCDVTVCSKLNEKVDQHYDSFELKIQDKNTCIYLYIDIFAKNPSDALSLARDWCKSLELLHLTNTPREILFEGNIQCFVKDPFKIYQSTDGIFLENVSYSYKDRSKFRVKLTLPFIKTLIQHLTTLVENYTHCEHTNV